MGILGESEKGVIPMVDQLYGYGLRFGDLGLPQRLGEDIDPIPPHWGLEEKVHQPRRGDVLLSVEHPEKPRTIGLRRFFGDFLGDHVALGRTLGKAVGRRSQELQKDLEKGDSYRDAVLSTRAWQLCTGVHIPPAGAGGILTVPGSTAHARHPAPGTIGRRRVTASDGVLGASVAALIEASVGVGAVGADALADRAAEGGTGDGKQGTENEEGWQSYRLVFHAVRLIRNDSLAESNIKTYQFMILAGP